MADLINLKWPPKRRPKFIYDLLNRLHKRNYTAVLRDGRVLKNLRATTIPAGIAGEPDVQEVVYYDPRNYGSLIRSSFLKEVMDPRKEKKFQIGAIESDTHEWAKKPKYRRAVTNKCSKKPDDHEARTIECVKKPEGRRADEEKLDLINLKWPLKRRSKFINDLLNRLHERNYTAVLRDDRVLENLRAITIPAGFAREPKKIPVSLNFFLHHSYFPEVLEVVYYDAQNYESLIPSSFLKEVTDSRKEIKDQIASESDKHACVKKPKYYKAVTNKCAKKLDDREARTSELVKKPEGRRADKEELLGSGQILSLVVGECCRNGIRIEIDSIMIPFCENCRQRTFNAKNQPGQRD